MVETGKRYDPELNQSGSNIDFLKEISKMYVLRNDSRLDTLPDFAQADSVMELRNKVIDFFQQIC